LLILVAGASTFGEFVTLRQIPEKIINLILPAVTSPILVILIVMGILFVVGCFIDTVSALLIFTPIVVPLCTKYNIDLIHLGLLMTVILGIGYVTPPFGANLYLAVGIHGAKFTDVASGAIPSITIWLIVLLILVLFPGISTFLPNLFMGLGG
jgi:C4-dicarboxylate transporter DctM subunit